MCYVLIICYCNVGLGFPTIKPLGSYFRSFNFYLTNLAYLSTVILWNKERHYPLVTFLLRLYYLKGLFLTTQDGAMAYLLLQGLH